MREDNTDFGQIDFITIHVYKVQSLFHEFFE